MSGAVADLGIGGGCLELIGSSGLRALVFRDSCLLWTFLPPFFECRSSLGGSPARSGMGGRFCRGVRFRYGLIGQPLSLVPLI